MKKNIKYKPTGNTHSGFISGPNNAKAYLLCGWVYYVWPSFEETTDPVTCEQCIAILESQKPYPAAK